MKENVKFKNTRLTAPCLDGSSGDDRRQVYDSDYFLMKKPFVEQKNKTDWYVNHNPIEKYLHINRIDNRTVSKFVHTNSEDNIFSEKRSNRYTNIG